MATLCTFKQTDVRFLAYRFENPFVSKTEEANFRLRNIVKVGWDWDHRLHRKIGFIFVFGANIYLQLQRSSVCFMYCMGVENLHDLIQIQIQIQICMLIKSAFIIIVW